MEDIPKSIEDCAKFVEDNKEIILRVLRPYRGLDEYDTLAQEAGLGMFKAIQTYSPDRGFDLTEYAYICAKNQIQMYLRSVSASD